MSPNEGPDLLGRVRFSQGLSLWRAMARGIGVMTAVVAFVLMGDVASAGPLASLAFLLAALLVVVNGLGYAELAANSSRSGGAYTLVYRATEDEGLAFLTGWTLALSGLGLCGLLAQGAARFLSQLITVSFGITVSANLLAMGLVALVVLGSGLGKRRRRRIDFTLPTLILLAVLALLAAPHIRTANFTTVQPQLTRALPTLIAAFTAMELITSRQREIRRKAVNVPRVLLLAPLVVAALGAGIVVVVVGVAGAQLAAAADAPLALVGKAIAGAWGQAGVLVAGIVVLLLSLDRALSMVVRHLYVMSRDGFWPAWLRQAHPKRGVPARLIALVGFLALPVVWVPLRLLSGVGGLLYLFTLMAVNLALARRPRRTPSLARTESRPDEDQSPSFALPFHPWIPALTLSVDLLVIPMWGLSPVVWAVGCLAVGGLVYRAYGRGRYIDAQKGITVFHSAEDERRPVSYRVLVPIANPATAGTLLRLAGQLAQARGGEVSALQVVVVPEPVPLETGRLRAKAGQTLLKQALTLANRENLPIQTTTRVTRNVAQGILDTATEEHVDLILTGWRGPIRSRETSLGPILDAVLRDAPCDMLVMRGQDGVLPEKILVPTSGGPHARAAARLALSLAEACQAEVTLLSVHSGPNTGPQIEQTRSRLAETLEGLSPARPPEQKLVVAASVVDGIVQEAQGYDLVLVGVSGESLLDRLVFGSVPLQVAMRVPATALVQGHRGITGVWTRRIVRAMRDNLPVLTKEEQLAVRQELAQGARPGINYFVLIVLSCIIAALGLLLDSPAVIIGAMLVAPLMSPIMAFSLGLVQGDIRVLRFSIEAIFKGVALAVIIAAFIGLISPLKTVTAEMQGRAQPTLLDLAVALASGMAGAYALARKDVSAALPGVAIAAALMPPLATVGLGLSMGDARVAGGALLLFATNIAAISLAGGFVFLLLGIRPRAWGRESLRQLRRRFAASLLLLLVVAIPLGIIMAGTVRDATQERAVEAALIEHLAEGNGHLMALEVEREGAGLHIVATVRSAQSFDSEMVDDLAEALSERLGRAVQLEVVVLPVVRSGEG